MNLSYFARLAERPADKTNAAEREIMSFVKKLAVAAVAFGALAYAPASFAQVGGGTEQPSDAKTTPQSKGDSSSDKGSMQKGSMSKDGSMEKSGGMKKEGSMEKSGDMK